MIFSSKDIANIATFLGILLTVINAASILNKNCNQSMAVAEFNSFSNYFTALFTGAKKLIF